MAHADINVMMRNAEAIELAKQLVKDQADWLDTTMPTLVRPEQRHILERLMEPGNEAQLRSFLHRNKIQVNFIDNGGVIVMVAGRRAAQFVPILRVDGRAVDTYKLNHPEDFQPSDIWAE